MSSIHRKPLRFLGIACGYENFAYSGDALFFLSDSNKKINPHGSRRIGVETVARG